MAPNHFIAWFLAVFVIASPGSTLPGQERPAGIQAQFAEADKNGDGELTSEEWAATGRRGGWIATADEDGNGTASLAEVISFLKKRGEPSKSDSKPVVIVGELAEDSPVTLAGIRKAAQYSSGQNGHTFLVMVRGKVVFERYENGWSMDRPHRLASGTKSFSAAILAAAVKDKLIASVEEPVSTILTEWKSEDRLSDISYRDLLSLTSGIDPGKVGNVPSYSEVAKIESVSDAGEKFRYGPTAFQVFGEAIRRKLVAREDLEFSDPLAYLQNRVFEPIGLEHGIWRQDKEGMPNLPSGAFLTAREWVKYGEFLRNGGACGGKQLVDAATLQEAQKGSEANAGYGLTLWLLDKDGKAAATWKKNAYMAAGAGKQRLFVLPEAGVVVVRHGESKRFDNEVFLKALFSKG